MALYFAPSLRTPNLQPWVGFGPSLSHSRLNTSGAFAHSALGDQGEQVPVVFCGRYPSRDPLGPQLHGVLEAQFTRVHAGIAAVTSMMFASAASAQQYLQSGKNTLDSVQVIGGGAPVRSGATTYPQAQYQTSATVQSITTSSWSAVGGSPTISYGHLDENGSWASDSSASRALPQVVPMASEVAGTYVGPAAPGGWNAPGPAFPAPVAQVLYPQAGLDKWAVPLKRTSAPTLKTHCANAACRSSPGRGRGCIREW